MWQANESNRGPKDESTDTFTLGLRHKLSDHFVECVSIVVSFFFLFACAWFCLAQSLI